jgi:hypothetical protein
MSVLRRLAIGAPRPQPPSIGGGYFFGIETNRAHEDAAQPPII